MLKNLYLFVGRSGSGKSTIVNYLTKYLHEKQVVSNTTRPRRFPEEDSYHFLSNAEFDALKNVIAPTMFAGNRYAVTANDLNAGSFYIVDIPGIIELKKHYTNRPIKVIGIHSTDEELLARMTARGDDNDSIQVRLKHDEQKFEAMFDYCDIIIRNSNIDEAINATIAYINAYEGYDSAHAREFFVNTPAGRLRACAKADYGKRLPAVDEPEDFPGIFIDLIRDGEDDILLSCTEWESCDKRLQTCVYGELNADEPTDVVVYAEED